LPEAFSIVGLGASAGGLEALEAFLGQLGSHARMALVVVQHLAPTLPGMMVELLQRFTPWKVQQAIDRMPVNPGCIYVIPPGKLLSIRLGRLYVLPLPEHPSPRLPIDYFFQALALDQGDRAVAMVFSGMGSDGLLGCKAVAEKGGLILVQDPATARSDGMPSSILKAGIASEVGSPARLAEVL